MTEQHYPQGSYGKEYRLFPGFSVDPKALVADDDLFWVTSDRGEAIYLRDRDFETINRCFANVPTIIMEGMIAQRGLPITVLDIAGGSLSVAARGVAGRYPTQTHVINADVLLNPKSPRPDNFTPLLSDATKLDLSDASVDFAYSYQFLTHLNPEREMDVLREISRVLKPGGVAVVDEDFFASQPASSETIKLLQDKLGVKVSLHKGNLKRWIGGESGLFTDLFMLLQKEDLSDKAV